MSQTDLGTRMRAITETISEENIKTKRVLEKLQPLVDFVDNFDTPGHLKAALDLLTEDCGDERLRLKKSLEEVAAETERDETRHKALALKKGIANDKRKIRIKEKEKNQEHALTD